MYGKSAMEIAAKDLEKLIGSGNANLKVIPGPVYNVQGYGARGDGKTDDTAAIQSTINDAGSGSTVSIPDGTYIVESLYVNKSIRFVGTGNSIIKFKNGLSERTNMINITKNGISVIFENVTFDGNKDNLTLPNEINMLIYDLIEWDLQNNSFSNDISELKVFNCRFLNIPSTALDVRGYDDPNLVSVENALYLSIENCYFEKGFEGRPGHPDTTLIRLTDNVNSYINRNLFIKNEEVLAYGLAAITVTTSETSREVFSISTITNNYFKNYGRQGAAGMGVVEFYASCENLIISGNKFEDSYNAAIRGKTNSKNIIISENLIDGSLINENTSDKSYGIAINRGTFFGIYGKIIISNNIITNIYGSGIIVTGSTSNHVPSGKVKDVIVNENIIEVIAEAGTTSYGININYFENANISSNVIKYNDYGILIRDCKMECCITGNQVYEVKKYHIASIGYESGDTGYTDYDANIVISNNQFRGSVPDGELSYRYIYFESIRNAIVTGNTAKGEEGMSPQFFLRTGSNVIGYISAHQNIYQGVALSGGFFSLSSGSLNQSNNLENGVIVT